MGDFNAHHTDWGCERSDYTSNNLLNSSLSHSFTCLNDGSPIFLSLPNQYKSAIDLTFASSSLLSHSLWEVLTDPMNSDHFPILISINIFQYFRKRHFFSHKIKLKKQDKKQFHASLYSNFSSLEDSLKEPSFTAVQKYYLFTNHIENQIPTKISKPHSTIRPKNPNQQKPASLPAPWWNEECDEAISERRKALSIYKQTPLYRNFIELKKQEAITKRTLKSAKRNVWKTFCSTLNSKTPISFI